MYHGERFNAYSHLIGALLALAGAVVLIVLESLSRDPFRIVSSATYGTSLVVLYGTSTLYHSTRGRLKAIFRRLDHTAIYLLIAGSYTPFTLVTLRGPWGWSLFGIVWGLAVLGIAQEFWPGRRTRLLSLVIYVLMGWLALVAIMPLMQGLSDAGFALLLVGGLTYTAGIVFYAYDYRFRHWHGIWHLFVIGGSAMHYFAILLFVAQ